MLVSGCLHHSPFSMHFLNAGPTFKIKSYRINEEIVSIEEINRKKKILSTYITCSWRLVTIFSRIPNLGIHDFFHKKCFLSFEGSQSVFLVKISSLDLSRKILPCFKRKQEKNREFVDSGFVKTCHISLVVVKIMLQFGWPALNSNLELTLTRVYVGFSCTLHEAHQAINKPLHVFH